MTPADLAFLTSERGTGLLGRLASADLGDAALLPLVTSLRAEFTPAESSAALALTRARRAAVAKFGADASRMFFEAEAVEQASHAAARSWRAHEAARLAVTRVLDVCCGVGADAFALAAVPGVQVEGLDLDPVRVALAQLNGAVLGARAAFRVGDARALPELLLSQADLIFFDPARRDERGRIYHVEGGAPPLSTVNGWGQRRIWAKLSPGVQIDQIARYLDEGAGLDFIAADGGLKEAMLRLNDQDGHRRAVMDYDGQRYTLQTDPVAQAPLGPVDGWLCEPDPAIIRAGAVGQVTLACGGTQLDDQIAYFTAPAAPPVPYVRAWRVREWLPYNVKKLRALLKSRGITRVTVKKRGTAVTPEALIAALNLPGSKGDACTLVLTRLSDSLIVIVCDEMPWGRLKGENEKTT